ncbi:uroporphyrinogen-III C-methyltransferase [Monashia sp. NPDC004114]
MSLDLTFSGRSVLLTGADTRTVATIDALVRDGAAVTVSLPDGADVSDLPTSVRDLADRGIVAFATDVDETAFDVVIRAGARGSESPRHHAAFAPVATPPGDGRDEAVATGTVTLVGGGLGDPGLLTVAGREAIRAADVIVHDRLAPVSALHEARRDASIIDVGKIPRGDFTPQERINAVLVEQALAGRNVVRLKGGDSFVFGRGGEEAEACAAEGIPVVVIPGVSSSIAGPALAGIPVTHRALSQGFTVVSGHVPPGDPRGTVDWGSVARSNTTIVVLMGVATLTMLADTLVREGLSPDTPAAVIADAGLPSMRSVRARLADIAEMAQREGLGAPAVVVVGAVAALDLLA